MPLPLFQVQGDGPVRFLVRSDSYEREPVDAPVYGRHEPAAPQPGLVPTSYVAEVADAIVSGKDSLVVAGHRRLVLPGPDCTWEEWPVGFFASIRRRGRRYWLETNPRLRHHRRFPAGVLVTNRFSPNHFHFLVEALQAVCLAESVIEDDSPVLLVARITERARQFLDLLVPRWPVLEIPRKEFWAVERLHLAVVGAYSPELVRERPRAAYETRLLPEVRRRILGTAAGTETAQLEVPASGILYVSRARHLEQRGDAGRGRDVVNSVELEEYVRSIGGTVVYPETMHAAEQALLFNGARIVIAPAGAAVANAIFCRPGTTWIVLHMRRLRLVNPWSFTPLAEQFQLDWRLVVGEGIDETVSRTRYAIPLTALEAALEDVRLRDSRLS